MSTTTQTSSPRTRVISFWAASGTEDADVNFEVPIELKAPLAAVPGLESSKSSKAQVVVILDVDDCWHGVYVDSPGWQDEVEAMEEAIKALTVAKANLQRLSAAA